MSEAWLPSEHGTDQGGLQKRVARGMTWTIIDNWGAQLLGLVILVILLRLLNVEDVGLVALAGAFVALAQIFVDQGLGDALIQRRSLTRSAIDTAFWTAVATGLILTAAAFLLAPAISALVREPRLTPILQVLSLSFLMTAFSSIQIALLQREMAFRSLAARRLIGVVGGGVIGIAFAFLNYGAWALVAQQLGQATIALVALWTVSPWRPGLSVSRTDFRSMFSFGLNIVAADFLNYVSRNVDNLLIGTFLGPMALGLYAVGYRILDTSSSMLIQAARKLLFPAFSRLQHDPDRLRRAYARMNRAMAAVTLPGYIGLAIVAQDAIVVFVGQRWADSGPVATVLLLIGPVLTIQAFSGGLLNAIGRPDVTLRFRFLSAVVNVVGFLVAVLVFGTIEAVAAAFVVRGYVLAPLILWWMQRYAGIPLAENLLRLAGVAAATAVMAAAVIALKVAVLPARATPGHLAIEVAVGAIVYAIALTLLERALVADLLRVGREALPSASLRRALGARPSRPAPDAPGRTAAAADHRDPELDGMAGKTEA